MREEPRTPCGKKVQAEGGARVTLMWAQSEGMVSSQVEGALTPACQGLGIPGTGLLQF